MNKVFHKLIEFVAAVQIALSPTLTGIILGVIIGITVHVMAGILIGLAGLLIGVLWAIRVTRNEGASHFMSRVMATPELDRKVDEEQEHGANKPE